LDFVITGAESSSLVPTKEFIIVVFVIAIAIVL